MFMVDQWVWQITKICTQYTVGPLYNEHFGNRKQFVIQRFPLFRGYTFHMHSNLCGPTKAVCYREVSTIRGVCFKRFHCTYILNHFSETIRQISKVGGLVN